MIIVHENLEREANAVAEALGHHFNINSTIRNEEHPELFRKIDLEGFIGDCYATHLVRLQEYLNSLGNHAAMLITSRDFYHDYVKSQKDDWVLGSNYGLMNFASVARLRGKNGNPSQKIEVPIEKYLRRVNALCLHEVGHDIVDSRQAKHMKMASWAPIDGEALPLGMHCTDNRCLMYEVVDVKTPPREEGCLTLADKMPDGTFGNTEERYDAGLDECIDRQYDTLLCGRCRDCVNIGKEYD